MEAKTREGTTAPWKKAALVSTLIGLIAASFLYSHWSQPPTAAAKPHAAAPEISYDREVDLGRINYLGEPVPVSIPLKNTSAARVTFESISRECACTQASVTPSSIGPGETATLDLKIDVQGVAGKTRTGVSVATAKGGHLAVAVTMEIAPVFKVPEDLKVWKVLAAPHRKVEREADLEWLGKERRSVVAACDVKFVRASLAEEGDRIRLRIEVDEACPSGTSYGLVHVLNGRTKSRILTIPFMVQVGAPEAPAAGLDASGNPATVLPTAAAMPRAEARNRIGTVLAAMEKPGDGAGLSSVAHDRGATVDERVLAIRRLGGIGSDACREELFALARRSDLSAAERGALRTALRTVAETSPACVAEQYRAGRDPSVRSLMARALAETQQEGGLREVLKIYPQCALPDRLDLLRSFYSFPDVSLLDFLRDLAVSSKEELESFHAVRVLTSLHTSSATDALRAVAASPSLMKDMARNSLHAR